MAAVIRPVCIENPDFRNGRVPLLFIFKIILDVKEIFKGHSQVQGAVKLTQPVLCKFTEALKNFNVFRLVKYSNERGRFRIIILPGIHRVNAEGFDGLCLLFRQGSRNDIGSSRFDNRILFLIQKLYTLFSRVCSLIKLPRQVFNGKYGISLFRRKAFFIYKVHRRLRKNCNQRLFINLF